MLLFGEAGVVRISRVVDAGVVVREGGVIREIEREGVVVVG